MSMSNCRRLILSRGEKSRLSPNMRSNRLDVKGASWMASFRIFKNWNKMKSLRFDSMKMVKLCYQQVATHESNVVSDKVSLTQLVMMT